MFEKGGELSTDRAVQTNRSKELTTNESTDQGNQKSRMFRFFFLKQSGGSEMPKQRLCALLIALGFLAVAKPRHANADAWVLNAPAWSRSYAEAKTTDCHDINDSGVMPAQTTATAECGTNDCVSEYAYGHGHSKGWWGSNVKVIAKRGGWAGEYPFGEPIEPVPGLTEGFADLDYEVSRDVNYLMISGTASYNDNGYLELAVVDTSEMTEYEVSAIFDDYGSVQYAWQEGYLADWEVLGHWREDAFMPGESFAWNVNVYGIPDECILVSSLGHAVSTPEPATVFLLGLGGLVLRRRRRG